MADWGLYSAVALGARVRARGLLVLSLVLLGFHQSVLGSPVKPGAAIVHFEQGSAAFAEGRFADALTAFQASMALEPSPNTRIKVARCYKALGQLGSAYVQFQRTAHEAHDRMNATGEARFAPTKRAAEAEAQALESAVPRLELSLPSPVPAELGLELDGTAVPPESFSSAIPIDPGPHRLIATAPRYAPFAHSFSASVGAKARVTVVFDRLPGAELQLAFAAKPAGMMVFIDGKPLSPEHFDKPRFVAPGRHLVEVRVPGYSPFLWQRKLVDGQQARVEIALHTEQGPLRWVALSVGGAAVVALAVGAGFGIVAQRTASEQTALDPLLRDHATQSTVQSQANIATGMLTVGGVLGGAAAVLGIVSLVKRHPVLPAETASDEGHRVTWQLVPQVIPSGIGLAAIGRY